MAILKLIISAATKVLSNPKNRERLKKAAADRGITTQSVLTKLKNKK